MTEVPRGWTGKWRDLSISKGRASVRLFFSVAAWTLVRRVDGEDDIKTRHNSRDHAIRQGRHWLEMRSGSIKCPTCLGKGWVLHAKGGGGRP